MTRLEEARQRAHDLLLSTDYFIDLGLGKMASEVRALANEALEVCDELEAERSARIAIQANRDECRAVIARQAKESAA